MSVMPKLSAEDKARWGQVEQDLLLCRVLGHAWSYRPKTAEDKPKRSSFGQLVHFRCLRCESERHDIYTVMGTLTARWYLYSDQYAEVGVITKEAQMSVSEGRRAIKNYLACTAWKNGVKK